MPVSPEIIHNPAAQDSEDLHLIYEIGDAQPPQWLQAALDGHGFLIAGRFNSRLLGAYYLRPESNGNYSLEQLQVRELTRRRSVARQLLHVSLRKLPEEVRSITADISQYPQLRALFNEVGFTVDETGVARWSRS